MEARLIDGFARPLLNADESGEVTLPSWARFSERDPLDERAVEQMLVGVSTRKYARSLEPVASTLATRGTSKSAVSRRSMGARRWRRRYARSSGHACAYPERAAS